MFCLFSLQGRSTDHGVLFAALATAVKATGAAVSWTAQKTDSLINRRNVIWSQHGDSAGSGVKGKYVCAPSLPRTDGEKVNKFSIVCRSRKRRLKRQQNRNLQQRIINYSKRDLKMHKIGPFEVLKPWNEWINQQKHKHMVTYGQACVRTCTHCCQCDNTAKNDCSTCWPAEFWRWPGSCPGTLAAAWASPTPTRPRHSGDVWGEGIVSY